MKMGRIFVVTCVQRTIFRTNEPVVIESFLKTAFILIKQLFTFIIVKLHLEICSIVSYTFSMAKILQSLIDHINVDHSRSESCLDYG